MMKNSIQLFWVLLVCLLGGCNKHEMNVPEEWTLKGHVDELTVNGLQNSIQADINVQYNFKAGGTLVTKTLKTDNNGDFTVVIPTDENLVRVLIEKDHFLGVDTLFEMTGTMNFNAQIVQLRNVLSPELNKEWQYEVVYEVGDTEGGGTTSYTGIENWKVTDLDTSTRSFKLQVTFNGIGIYSGDSSRDTTIYENQVNTLIFSIQNRRLQMTPCISCSQRTTIFDRLNTLLTEINDFTGFDMTLLVEHPISVTDSLGITETDMNGNSLAYVLSFEEGLISLNARYSIADVFEIYDYHLITH
jgi:hypothetical protein